MGMIQNGGGGLRDEIAPIRGQFFRVAGQFNPGQRWRHLYPYLICESDGVHDGPEIVVAVETPIQNAKDQIDFGGSMNGERCFGRKDG